MLDLPIEVEEVRVLRLQPGDVLVARVAEEATPDAVEIVRKRLEAMFPDHKTLVCLGITLEVVRAIEKRPIDQFFDDDVAEQFDGTSGEAT